MATTKKAVKAPEGLTAYCMKTKEKNVPLQDAVISITNGRYIAKGHDGNGNNMTTILNATKAEEAIEKGYASKGEGWAKSSKKAAAKA